MKKIITTVLQILIICIVLFSCEKTDQSITLPFSRSIARYVDDDGWVYTATYFYFNDGTFDDSIPPLEFNVMNLRHRDIDYIMSNQEKKQLARIYNKESTGILILGENVDANTDSDMQAIADYLGYGKINTKFLQANEIIHQDRSDIEFSVLSKDLVFNLIDEAYEGDARIVGKYIDYPTYALLCEPQYIDGYRFQIGFALGMGNIDVICIDLLFSTDNGSISQLSDMIRNTTATEKECRIFQQISNIENGIVKNNDFLFGNDLGFNSEFEGIDFSRLYSFLADIDCCEIEKYLVAQ